MRILQGSGLSQHRIELGESRVELLATGDIWEYTVGSVMMNAYRPDGIHAAVANLWLRLYQDGEVQAYRLIGRGSGSRFSVEADRVRYRGQIQGVRYELQFVLGADETAYWVVELEGQAAQYDLLLGLDLGLADRGAVLANELYSPQYIDYQVFEDARGWHIAARQNMTQGGRNPARQLGVLEGKAVGYATDGLRLFGTEYRRTELAAMKTQNLPSEIVQGEFAYTALQTEAVALEGEARVVFYSRFEADKREPNTTLDPVRVPEVGRLGEIYPDEQMIPALAPEIAGSYSSLASDEARIYARYPEHYLEEVDEAGELLSFFTRDHRHVVTQAKELAVERPHGTISTSFLDLEQVSTELMTTTSYMSGIFHSQAVVGNTTFCKGLSVNRGYLGQTPHSGQRVYVKLDGSYRRLAVPAFYEMGMGHAKWYYKLPNGDVLEIIAATLHDSPTLVLDIRSIQGQPYDLLITQQLVLGEHEFGQDIGLETSADGSVLRFTRQPAGQVEPGLAYTLQVPSCPYDVLDDGVFYADGKSRNGTLVVLSVERSAHTQLLVTGGLELAEADLDSWDLKHELVDLDKNRQRYTESYSALMRGLEFSLERDDSTLQDDLDAMTETLWWFSHNAMVHFAVPHGLEQPGGAAWGTRDVCQGPLEYLYSFGHYPLARAVLLLIYKHQQVGSGEWPQWFMFDRFPYAADDAHGDVVFWPLKSLSEYLLYTGDLGILDERVPLQEADGSYTEAEPSLLEHVKLAYEAVQTRFLDGGYLISFAGGDWNDTLQPASPELRESLVSTWTQALAYQALGQLAEAVEPRDAAFAAELAATTDGVREAFLEYLVKDGVVSGLASRREDGGYDLLLHPDDTLTGISYRLLPMTRSIIAGMVDEAQASKSFALIEEHLLHPDGARLMNKPPQYNGGVSEIFERAEQATYIGRELSLMYTHAHIRYMEALAKVGRGGDAWSESLKISPVAVNERVPNATRRQRNLYFSSSEGDYKTRREFAEQFERLRDGSIPVKGGWRLYSSGPGIFTHQIVTNMLGLHLLSDGLEIRPSLAPRFAGLRVRMECFGQTITFVYEPSPGSLAAENAKGQSIGKQELHKQNQSILTLSRADVLAAGGTIRIMTPTLKEEKQ